MTIDYDYDRFYIWNEVFLFSLGGHGHCHKSSSKIPCKFSKENRNTNFQQINSAIFVPVNELFVPLQSHTIIFLICIFLNLEIQ